MPRLRRLTNDQAREIREIYAAKTAKQPALAKQYGVAKSLVSLIVRGLRYRDADGPISGKKYERAPIK